MTERHKQKALPAAQSRVLIALSDPAHPPKGGLQAGSSLQAMAVRVQLLCVCRPAVLYPMNWRILRKSLPANLSCTMPFSTRRMVGT